MKIKNTLSPAYIIASSEIGHLIFIANSLIKSIKLLIKKENKENNGYYIHTYNLLISLAFELLPKILIILKICYKNKDSSLNEGDLKLEIIKKLKVLNHNLNSVLNETPEIINLLKIEKIEKITNESIEQKDILKFLNIKEKINNPYISEYRFWIKNDDIPLMIKDFESIRYGSFSNNRDVLLISVNDDLVLKKLEKLFKYIKKEKVSYLKKIKNKTLKLQY